MNDVTALITCRIPAAMLEQFIILDGTANQEPNLTSRRTEAPRELVDFRVAHFLAVVLAFNEDVSRGVVRRQPKKDLIRDMAQPRLVWLMI
jgi:hypothetical protein